MCCCPSNLAVIANMGALVEPIAYAEYVDHTRTKRLPPGLYGHNTMQDDMHTVHSGFRDAKGTAILDAILYLSFPGCVELPVSAVLRSLVSVWAGSMEFWPWTRGGS